jgi:hypothetical protein
VFFTVEKAEPPHALVLHSTRHVIKPIRTVDFGWAFIIRLLPRGRSRLLIRARTSYTPRRALPFVDLVIGPADFVNAGAMLRGLKQRVETAKVRPLPTETDETARLAGAGEPRLAESEREVVSLPAASLVDRPEPYVDDGGGADERGRFRDRLVRRRRGGGCLPQHRAGLEQPEPVRSREGTWS